jgi:hypothetical protein
VLPLASVCTPLDQHEAGRPRTLAVSPLSFNGSLAQGMSAAFSHARKRLRGRRGGSDMVRIAISVEAFEAIARTLRSEAWATRPGHPSAANAYVWLEAAMVNRLGAMRGPGGRLATLSYLSRGRRRLPLDAGKTKLLLGAG